jgi:fucose permease
MTTAMPVSTTVVQPPRALLGVIYIAFVGLGLPDTVLGSAWPAVRREFALPLDAAGSAVLLATAGVAVSSLATARLLARYGTGRVLVGSSLLAGAALVMNGLSPGWWLMLAAAVVAGLGGGAVDTALNGFVARHYGARHMNWLHGSWGIGGTLGPLVAAMMMAQTGSWRPAYLLLASAELALTVLFMITLPAWREEPAAAPASLDATAPTAIAPASATTPAATPASSDATAPTAIAPASATTPGAAAAARAAALPTAPAAPGPATADALPTAPGAATAPAATPRAARASVAMYAVYGGLESSIGLWSASYLVATRQATPATAGAAAAMYWGGLTAGRLVLGFFTTGGAELRVVRAGLTAVLPALVILAIPQTPLPLVIAALVVLGAALGPVYPTVMHDTPHRFGDTLGRRLVGYQVAACSIGIAVIPWAIGALLRSVAPALLPLPLAGLAIAALWLERARRR